MTPKVSYWIGLSLPPFGSWALMRDYCWGSPSSLYTFRETVALHGLARDYHIPHSLQKVRDLGFPEFTQFITSIFL